MKFTDTKLYDLLAGVPVMVWYGYSTARLRPALLYDMDGILTGVATPAIWLEFLGLAVTACFYLLIVYLLVVRETPRLRSHGLLPYLCGFLATFMGIGTLRLPLAQLSLLLSVISDVLILSGTTLATVALWRLGKSFSVMAEARSLVTGGAYAYARHPLYTAEIITITGVALRFEQPWALLLAAATVLLQVARSVYEERVLSAAFPEYAAYRARTKRFIPGVI